MKTSNTKYEYTVFRTNWGYFGLCCSKTGIVRTSLPAKTKTAAENQLFKGLTGCVQNNAIYKPLQDKIRAYYQGTYVDFSKTPVDLSLLTPFTQQISLLCMGIKLGNIMSYKDLAALAGRPNAARATGCVMARNPIPLIIPCHRVIGSDGSLGGFSAAGGTAAKKRMLALETKSACSGNINSTS